MPFNIPNSADTVSYPGLASPDSQDFAAITQGSGLTGVISGCAATVTGSDMNVSIASGVVIIAGKEVAVASGNVTIGTAHGTYARYDLITVNTSGTKSVTAGSAIANPVMPAIPANSCVLHVVYVPANDTTIQSGQIVDKRVVIVRDTDWMAYIHF